MSVGQVGIIILLHVRGTGLPSGKNMGFESHLHAFKSPLGFLAQNLAPQNLRLLIRKMGVTMIYFMELL